MDGQVAGYISLTFSVSFSKYQNIIFPQKFWQDSFRVMPSLFLIGQEVHSDLVHSKKINRAFNIQTATRKALEKIGNCDFKYDFLLFSALKYLP